MTKQKNLFIVPTNPMFKGIRGVILDVVHQAAGNAAVQCFFVHDPSERVAPFSCHTSQ